MDAQQLSHTQSMDELSATLSAIGIAEVPQQPNTYPALNPVDIYRSHITELLAPVAGVDPKIVFNALQWTNTLEKGDLVLAAPALRLKGKKPDELAKDLAEKVKYGNSTFFVPSKTD
jgi:arginyl-tRNA synthetase